MDDSEYQIIEYGKPPEDPINFVDTKKYKDRLKKAKEETGQDETMEAVSGYLNALPVTVVSMTFAYLGGSINPKSGEIFLSAAEHAIKNSKAFIVYTTSGGMRMQTGNLSLQQMGRMTIAMHELKKKNIPFIVILTNPTTGGVTASWAMLGDILISEPKSVIGFAGRRVIQDTVRETLPDDFQTAEYVKDHGGLDLIVERKYLNSTIGTLLNVLLKKAEAQAKQDSNVKVDKSLQEAS